MKKMIKKMAEGGEKLDFEASLKRLESIVKDMESGSLSLDEMISRFEEGQNLLGFCSKKLNEVERKIEILVKKGEKITTEPFEDDAEQEETGEEENEEKGKELF